MQEWCWQAVQRQDARSKNPNKQLPALPCINMPALCATQSACASPVGAGAHGASPAAPDEALALIQAPSPAAGAQASPLRQGFPAMDARSLASLQAAFGQDFVSEHLAAKLSKAREPHLPVLVPHLPGT